MVRARVTEQVRGKQCGCLHFAGWPGLVTSLEACHSAGQFGTTAQHWCTHRPASPTILEYRNIGLVDYWNGGILECGNIGMLLEYWNVVGI